MTARASTHRPEAHRNTPVKTYCRAATTASITIATALNNGDSLDGVTLATGDRVFVKDQSTGSQNGIYVVGASPGRAEDMDTAAEVQGVLVYVLAGTVNAGTLWANTNLTAVTLETTALTFAEVSGSALTVEDEDASPSVSSVDTLQVPNSGLVDDGGGTVSLEYVLPHHGGNEKVDASHGSAGSTETIDLAAGNWHALTLNAECTLTLTGATASKGCSILVEVAEDSTGGWGLILPASFANKTELEAAQDTTADVVTFLLAWTRDGGTVWYGAWVGGGGSSVAALDDLTDVTITSPVTADRLRYDGSGWVNSALKWSPTTTFDGTNWLLVVDGSGNPVLTEV
jgi:hypothetical protein